MADSDRTEYQIPFYYRCEPPLPDDLETETSIVQDKTVKECLPLLNEVDDASRSPFDFNEFGLPNLEKEKHIGFLHDNLGEFPAPFVGLDASRPWMVYWALLGLYLLGEDISVFRSRVVKTFYSMQHPDGGIGGGFGQYAHLAGTYAALLSLALVGGEEAYGLVDRQKMWHWLGRLKQADGGFKVSEGAEEDTRGALCALLAISLLNLPLSLPRDSPARAAGLETFRDGLGEYLSRCQTYEGGIAASPGGEAHGSYAFCALACLCLYGPPDRTINKFLDVDALLWWLSSRQYAPEGGLAGRTNKLVDGCYSHWLGSCWPLIQAAVSGPRDSAGSRSLGVGENLYSSEGLARYILCCCQAEEGGLRDKPSKHPDSYHTCYTLCGLSTVEHSHSYALADNDDDPFSSAFSWEVSHTPIHSEQNDSKVFDTGAGVKKIHPIYTIPHDAALAIRQWFLMRPLDVDAYGNTPTSS
ncbi:protein farnesyltransferase subunit beta [Cladophialophora yegresii CBS 114405]|uniref:Protein farnesyltransferase subunit beta n=1 Tax=Cladophialophora yegresii CBS 114405 TaxID=1182544 RepID=W9WNW0_9EURO|nr:protein farnesyltransferase subunit beta [Cladophialophora yegresii CBS 114405]EXJ60109.1 protein farnesyltransferase subunit beta [Cladophialophora yegresii CBS 114405]